MAMSKLRSITSMVLSRRFFALLVLIIASNLSNAAVVHVNGSNQATSVTGLDVGGSLYDVTSFDGTGAGAIEFWANSTEAQTAANALIGKSLGLRPPGCST